MASLRIGTCSWNYPSWKGLVYSRIVSRSADFLTEYSARFRTAEIDSWFYKIPARGEVEDYLSKVDAGFTFACKLTEVISLTHLRTHNKADKSLVPNPTFLCPDLFAHYIESIRPMLPQLSALQVEFEYLNKGKMPSLDIFLKTLGTFVDSIEQGLPLAIETRNGNFLTDEYFAFLKEKRLAHVFSEKLHLPHIYEVFERYGHLLTDHVVVRLLGGDRKEIEKKTGEMWNQIVEEKSDLPQIARMIDDLLLRGIQVQVYVNNHYEGSAPKTIEKLERMLRLP